MQKFENFVKLFTNGSSANINFSKNLMSKIQSGGFN